MTQAHEVETRLREMILEMELGPGERLTERWAEAQLGASRTPVRAALLRLETDGLVRREGRGWRVAPLDLDEIEQLYVYREVLESAAARLVADHAAPDALARLEAELDAHAGYVSRENAHRAGTAFHLRLAELAGNAFIQRGIADAITRLSRTRWLDTGPGHDGRDEHRAILAALREGKAELAAGLVAAHVRESRERLLATLRQGRRSLRARGFVVA